MDKYSPRYFMNLLSDEVVNREVAKWLKSWDPLVFGRPAPGSNAGGSSQFPGAPGAAGTKRKVATAFPAVGKEAGASERPSHNVILMCGPPGLGKTTLAHVVARHCGYRWGQPVCCSCMTSNGRHEHFATAVVCAAFLEWRNNPD